VGIPKSYCRDLVSRPGNPLSVVVFPVIQFSACGNTKEGMKKKEGQPITVLSEAVVVPSGVIRLMELQEKRPALTNLSTVPPSWFIAAPMKFCLLPEGHLHANRIFFRTLSNPVSWDVAS
jgi:hypothetical protein